MSITTILASIEQVVYTLYSHFAFNWLWANPVTSMLCKPSFYDLRHQIDFTSKSSNFLLKIYYLWEKESQILFYPNTTSVLHSTYHYHFLSKERYHLPTFSTGCSVWNMSKLNGYFTETIHFFLTSFKMYGFSTFQFSVSAILFGHSSIRTPCIRDLGFFA